MVEDPPIDQPIILFDGVCNLCEGFVQYIIRRDPDAIFKFAPIQSEIGEQLVTSCTMTDDPLEGVILIEDGACYRKSDAVIRTFALLGWPYRALSPTRFVPRILRDIIYAFVADRRYGWFGKRDECMMPTPDIRARFLAGAPGTQPDE